MRSQVDRFCSVFFHFWCTEAPFGQMQCCTTNLGKISLKFTDKASIFDDLSVSKTHFTDKPAFFSDLSVNFWPLWWGFTDKSLFSEHLSVKPGPKRLKSYGQKAIFAYFVRNRHFSSKPFTDKGPIFSDVSVNGRDFAKCSAAHRLLNHRVKGDFKFTDSRFSDISIIAVDCHSYAKPGWYLQIIRVFSLRNSFFQASIGWGIHENKKKHRR